MAKRGEITADAGLAQAETSAAYFKELLKGGMPMGPGMGSMREIDYKGHHVTIATTYKIKIDGKPFKGELSVSNAGSVHYHGIPNVAFDSAVQLVQTVIDTFPQEFDKLSKPPGHGGMGAMKMVGHPKPTAKKKPMARK
jgi:hypothetical protein